MNGRISFFRKLGQILTIFVLGIALLFTTACNSGDLRGARPDNLPVQMGGQNNPHKGGGDGYTNYKMSTDPKVKDTNHLRSSVDAPSLTGSHLIADANIKSNASDLLYPGTNTKTTDNPDIGPKKEALEPEAMPARGQTIINRSDPNEKILEKIGKQFEDASEFVKDSLDTAVDRGISDEQVRTRGAY